MPPGEYKAPDIVLKEGNDDDAAVAKYSKKASGDSYIAGSYVEELQLRLLEFGFYDLGGADAYYACNKDREFEGDFDKWGVTYSKYSDNPRHVGLSFGIIQFTQEGSLGLLVNKMYAADPDKFKEIFGPKFQDLIDTLNLTGDYRLVEEEITEKDGTKVKKNVKRKPSVEPVDGNELWESPWVERFIEAGKVKIFQKCQDALAVEEYLDVRLPFCQQQGIVTQPAVANVYDRSVNEGWGQEEAKSKSGTPPSEKNIAAFQESNPLYNINSKEFWIKYADSRPDGIKSRINKIAESDQVSWEKEYAV